jgi:hypothetical protein
MSTDPDTASLLALITERETTTAAAAEQLRQQITELTDQLIHVDTELTELAITRRTLLRLAGPTDTPPAGATVTSPAYQQIIAVFTTTTTRLRAKDVCHALGIGTTANDTESLRAKLKRLVARNVLVEPEPGLFTLADTSTEATTSSSIPDPNPERT